MLFKELHLQGADSVWDRRHSPQGSGWGGVWHLLSIYKLNIVRETPNLVSWLDFHRHQFEWAYTEWVIYKESSCCSLFLFCRSKCRDGARGTSPGVLALPLHLCACFRFPDCAWRWTSWKEVPREMHVHSITLQRLEEKQASLARIVWLKIVLNLFYMNRLHKYNNINLGISINVTTASVLHCFTCRQISLLSSRPLCLFTFHNW